MGIFSVLKGVSKGYSPLESALFDRMSGVMTGPLHDFAMDEIASQLEPKMRVLDVGCGGGQFALRLAERFPSLEIVGLDLSPEQIGRARSRAGAVAERVRFVEGSATALPFAEDEFDFVYSLGSIKHWPEQDRGLFECARVLRSRGRFWVIEGDRGARIQDVRALIDGWGVPAPLRPIAIAFFRDVVAGHSLDFFEARELLASIPSIAGEVERGFGLPLWVIRGGLA